MSGDSSISATADGREPAAPGTAQVIGPRGRLLCCAVLLLTTLAPYFYCRLRVHPGLTNRFAVDADVWKTLEYLRANTLPSDVVFARPGLSSLIPAVSGNTVIWGHWAQSVDANQRMSTLQRVFSPGSGLSDAQRSDEFWSMGVKYVLADPWFRHQLLAADPRWLTRDLQQIWESGATALYKKSSAP